MKTKHKHDFELFVDIHNDDIDKATGFPKYTLKSSLNSELSGSGIFILSVIMKNEHDRFVKIMTDAMDAMRKSKASNFTEGNLTWCPTLDELDDLNKARKIVMENKENVPDNKTGYCLECGNQILKSANYCVKCGKKLNFEGGKNE